MDVWLWLYGVNYVIGLFLKYINGEMKGDYNLLYVNIIYFLVKKKKIFFRYGELVLYKLVIKLVLNIGYKY